MVGEKLFIRRFIITTFVSLYVITSLVSMVHVISFFRLSNPEWLAITLSIAYEIGAAASLAAIIALRKMNKSIVWGLFIILTLMQAMGNTYFAYVSLDSYQSWSELFNLIDMDSITQKRVLSLVSGAILPVIALGFVKALIDYIRPDDENPNTNEVKTVNTDNKTFFTPQTIFNKPTPLAETTTNEPIIDKSVTEEPLIEEIIIEAPIDEDDIINEPTSDVPVVDENVTQNVGVEEPIIEEVVANEPITEKERGFLNKINFFKNAH